VSKKAKTKFKNLKSSYSNNDFSCRKNKNLYILLMDKSLHDGLRFYIFTPRLTAAGYVRQDLAEIR